MDLTLSQTCTFLWQSVGYLVSMQIDDSSGDGLRQLLLIQLVRPRP